MLKYINSEAPAPKLVSLFSKVGCPFCARTKSLLTEHGLDYEEIVLGQDAIGADSEGGDGFWNRASSVH